MKVAIIGSNGQLGTDIFRIYEASNYKTFSLTHKDLDVADFENCRSIFVDINPDLMINTAAFHNVDLCEKEPDSAFKVNSIGARNLALLSNEFNFTLVHISTDYVFDGTKRSPYKEDDCPLPLNVYGNSKLSGELFVRTIAKRHFVIRVSGIFGSSPCRAKGGLNFVQLMLKIARDRGKVRVVDDEALAPTYTVDIAKQLERLTKTKDYGLYHIAAQEGCTWYEFASKIFELTGTKVDLSRAEPGEFPSKVRRPKYSILHNSALQTRGIEMMPHWSDGLKRYLKSMDA